MCVYTEKKNQVCFWQEPLDGISKTHTQQLLTQLRPFLIYEFKNYVFIFFKAGTC